MSYIFISHVEKDAAIMQQIAKGKVLNLGEVSRSGLHRKQPCPHLPAIPQNTWLK